VFRKLGNTNANTKKTLRRYISFAPVFKSGTLPRRVKSYPKQSRDLRDEIDSAAERILAIYILHRRKPRAEQKREFILVGSVKKPASLVRLRKTVNPRRG